MPSKAKSKYRPSKAQQKKSAASVVKGKGVDPGNVIKKKAALSSDLKETKSVKQTARRGKLRKKYGDKKVNQSIGGKKAVADSAKRRASRKKK
jgi:hypothetical protein